MKSYFQGRKELFEGLAIAQLEKEWAEYPVFHIDFNGVDFTQPDALDNKLEGLLASWESRYGKTTYWKNIGDRFAYVLRQAHRMCGRRCVVLVDEYDKPMLDVLDGHGDKAEDGCGERRRDILKGFYSVFKAADEDLHFVLLSHSRENLNELTGRYYLPQSFFDYKSSTERALPMLYQSGYLTIKAYNPDMGSYLLDFPNNEVKNGFVSLVASDYLRPYAADARKLYKIGASFSSRTGTVEEWRTEQGEC